MAQAGPALRAVRRAGVVVTALIALLTLTATAASARAIDGTDGPDTLIGTPESEVIYGRGGDDHIDAGDSSDGLAGDDGNDTLVGGCGDNDLDIYNGGPGHDTAYIGPEDEIGFRYGYSTQVENIVYC
jgi:Ca2+-binding RTX toxin-like protein